MESLFVYGTLRDPQVQANVFGRVVQGQADTLDGYRKAEITIGGSVYPIAVADPMRDQSIAGQVLEVTPAELVDIDRYEGDEYRRVRVRLRSGLEAWVYCK